MKVLIALLSIALSMPVLANTQEIDVTTSPDIDALTGYKHTYLNDCNVTLWQAQWGSIYLMPFGDCDQLTQEQIYNDAMLYVKQKKGAVTYDNLSDYLDSIPPYEEIPPSENIYINVSQPGLINPYYGYRMDYTDKDGESCKVRFHQMDGGLAYLMADKKCPDFATKERIQADASKAYRLMTDTTNAQSFAEYFGEDENGNKVKRAEPTYRCAYTNKVKPTNPLEWADPLHVRMPMYMFMPVGSSTEGWYQLDYYPDSTEFRRYRVGKWSKDGQTITGIDNGRFFTISDLDTMECYIKPDY